MNQNNNLKQMEIPLFITVYDGSKTKSVYRGWGMKRDIEYIPFTYKLRIIIENKWSSNILFRPDHNKPNRYENYTYRKNVISFKLIKEYCY